jgi:tRNA(Ile)-lysidine synthase
MSPQDTHLTWAQGLDRLRDSLRETGISLEDSSFLIAASGGVDSMCMLRCFVDLGVRTGVAHMNYGLRGVESDLDETLVEDTCRNAGVPLYVKHVDMGAAGEELSGGVQEQARKLRYTWFEELRQAGEYDYVCTAHHRDDAIETFFINLIRGTGLRGFRGIPVRRGAILRPMLCFTRDEISILAREKEIPFREDLSNLGREYLRNRIRHDLIPLFTRENPNFRDGMSGTLQRIASEYALLAEYLDQVKRRLVHKEGTALVIDAGKLNDHVAPEIILHAILGPYGFTLHQCRRLVSAQHEPGARYLSEEYTCYVDRGRLLVCKEEMHVVQMAEMNGCGVYTLPEGTLSIEPVDVAERTADPRLEYIDAGKVPGKLSLRRWREGDYFYPFGGTGRKKLQDYFTDRKLSVPAKRQVWILTCDGDIVWICGMRLDDRFRVTPATQSIFRLSWKPRGKG